MILKIFSELETFKTLTFHAGLNILLAEKSPGATDRQSRNGAGKSRTSPVSIANRSQCKQVARRLCSGLRIVQSG
jgi:hypothetical protein